MPEKKVASKSKEEMETVFKEKEVVIGEEKIMVRQWSAYKFVKLLPRIQRLLDKLIGEDIRKKAAEDPVETFKMLEDLVPMNLFANLADVFAVASEEMYEIIKVTIDRDDEWMKEIPFIKLSPLAEAIIEVCLTKDVVKNVMSLLSKIMRGGKLFPSGK